MSSKSDSSARLVLVVLTSTILAWDIVSATTWTVCSCGRDITSIRAAVDAAGSGDAIEPNPWPFCVDERVTGSRLPIHFANVGGVQEDAMASSALPNVIDILPVVSRLQDIDLLHRELVVGSHDEMLRIDTRTLSIENLGDLPELFGGYEMLVDPTTGWSYASGGESLLIVDRHGSLVTARNFGRHFGHLSAMDVSRRLYYLARNGDPYWEESAELDIYSMDSGERIETYLLCDRSSSLYRPVVDPYTGEVWLTCRWENAILILDGDTFEWTTIPPLAGHNYHPGRYVIDQNLVMVPSARRAYAYSHEYDDTQPCEHIGLIRVFDLDSKEELAPVSLAEKIGCDSGRFEHIVANPANGRIYATTATIHGRSDPNLVVIDPSTGDANVVSHPYANVSMGRITLDVSGHRALVEGGNWWGNPAHSMILVYNTTPGAENFLGYVQIDASPIGQSKIDPWTGRMFHPTLGGLFVLGDHVEVDVDIKPGGFPNTINPRSRGVIPVALLGSGEFDVADVDVSTLRFGPDQATPRNSGHLEDVNYDGILDLVVHFRMQETGIQCADTEAILTGSLLSGELFLSTDSLVTVGCETSSRQRLWLNERERLVRTDGRVNEPELEDSSDQE